MNRVFEKYGKALAVLLGFALVLGACDMLTAPGNNSGGGSEGSRQAGYTLSVSKDGATLKEYAFPAVYPGYDEVPALSVEVTNNGPGSAESIIIGLSGEGAGGFALSTEKIERLEAGGSAAFTVKPQAGLGGGEYRATVTAKDEKGGASQSFEVSFIVSSTPLYGITLNVENHSFPPKGADYGALEPLTVAITNIGNEGTGTLSIQSAANFQVNPSTISNIESGGTGTFTVQPLSGLTEGTYTGNVTVSGGHDLTASFPVSFQVFADLIEINTAEELALIGTKYPADGTYLLNRSLDLSSWTPVTNTKEAPFSGVFMGNNNGLRIFSYDPAVLNTDPAKRLVGYIGVFGYIQGGRVENLTVDLQMPDETISNATPGMGVDQYIGGVSGYAKDTTFENITVTGAINLSKGDGGDIYLGGITGYLEGGSINASNVVDLILISQEPYTAGSGSAYAGGLAAYAESGATISQSNILDKSTGKAMITAYADRYFAYAGGATGMIVDSTITRTVVSVKVIAEVAKDFEGMTTFGNSAFAGGITGIIGGLNVSSQISQCYTTGDVSAITYAPVAGGNPLYAGGIVGSTGVNGQPVLISDCYSRGNISAKTAPNFVGEMANLYAGGIAGRASIVTIQNCYATGIITVDSNQAAGNFVHAGGIAAVLSGQAGGDITVQQCAALSPQINWRQYTKDNMILKRVAIRGLGTNWEGISGNTLDQERYPERTTLAKNIANQEMKLNYDPSPQQAQKEPGPIIPDPGPGTEDGANCPPRPEAKLYIDLGWDFGGVWRMGGDGYPILQWQK